MSWWLWLLLGLALLASEAFTPGAFFVFFFGLSAIAVGLAVRLGPHTPGWFQWLLFSLLSVLSVVFLRGPHLRRIMPVRREGLAVDALVGEVAVPLHDLAPGGVGTGEIPEQICITRDNVQVHVDGVLYLKVLNPERASYGVTDYLFAITQLAQTALRSEIGKIDLDKTFESRTQINLEVVNELDKATEPWGIKVLRYEIKNITPPADVLAAMEKQMRAEREKRATVLTSEGQRDAAINTAEGQKQQVIKASEAKRQQQINEAEGQAAAILAVADATAEGIRKVAETVRMPGGFEAVQLRVAEQYIGQFGELAKASNTLVLPATVSDVGSMLALAMNVIGRRPAGGAGPPSA